MRHLILSPNCILSQNFLLEKIWKYSPNTETTTISAHINTLRAKLPSSMIENTCDGLKLYVENLF
jgi:DNA-binding response OmpR family regulator